MKISVVIPVYNAEKYLSKCLDSVAKQTYTNWEVIAIDDGSKDGSYSILTDYGHRDKRFRVASQENQGPGQTRNKAISLATGDYIVFLDADDYIDDKYFEDLVDCAVKNQSDVIFVDVLQEKPNGTLIKAETMSSFKRHSKASIIRNQMTGKLPWGGCRKAVKTLLLKDNNIKFSEDAVGEEALFSFRILANSNVISFIEKPYYHYVNYPNSQSKKGDDDPWGNVCKNVRNYLYANGLYEEYKDAINSFGYTALIVSIFRMSQNYGFMDALMKSRRALQAFKQEYEFDLDRGCLERRTLLVLPLVRLDLVWPIIVLAKFVIYLRRKNS